MEGIERLFSRKPLPCAFTVHHEGAVRQVGEGPPAFAVHLRNGEGWKALRSLDELTIADAFVRGDIELEGDEIRAMWLRGFLADDNVWLKTWRRLQPLLVGRERLNPGWIAKHYDSANVQLWALDRDYRAYTPGIFESEDETLEVSTRRKYDFAFDGLGLKPGDVVLDVGHGWGGFIQYCAERGVRVEGITLSRDQLGWVQRMIAEKKLDASAAYQDFFTYRPGRRYDGISVMGVIEDLSDYPRVLAHLSELLAPGRRVYLDYAAGKVPFGTSSFVTKHIWPGTFRMTYVPELLAALDRSPFHLVGLYDDRRNYHLWAKKGHERWLANREQIVAEAGEETWRLFRLLFAGTAGVMNDPACEVTAYRMLLELPAERARG